LPEDRESRALAVTLALLGGAFLLFIGALTHSFARSAAAERQALEQRAVDDIIILPRGGKASQYGELQK
jgi:hypothetical protein